LHDALPPSTAEGTAQRAQLRDLVDITPPVFAAREAIRHFLSFEYEEGVWWFDEPSEANDTPGRRDVSMRVPQCPSDDRRLL
jgi:hypothetical protein